MFATIINDCRDQNAMGRQSTRIMSLFGCPVTSIGVTNDLEAAGTLVDALDAAEKGEGIVLVNVAPRQRNGHKMEDGGMGYLIAKGKKRRNGSPFGAFSYGKTLVISSLDGFTLALAKKLGIVKRVSCFHIPTIVEQLVKEGILANSVGARMVDTQFRSFDFLPRAAKWLLSGVTLPFEERAVISTISSPLVWLIDSFGNVKTTLLAQDIEFAEGRVVKTAFGKLACYSRLKDVPEGAVALVIGSSGIEDKRFCEIVIQGKSAAAHLGVKVGAALL